MELTDAERLILSNQYRILAKLEGDDEHYSLMADTFHEGYKWLYDQYLDNLGPNLDDDKATFVVDILDLYSSMRSSYRDLEDKSDIDGDDVKFPGFDGNNEGDLMGFADMLVKHRRFMETLRKHGNNSHMPTVDIYRRMLACWNGMGQPTYPYSKEQILQLLDARRYR